MEEAMPTQGPALGRAVMPFVRGRRVLALGLIAVVPLLVLAACGGEDAPSAEAPTSVGGAESAEAAPDAGGDTGDGGDIDLCAVLTLDDVSEATGVEVTGSTSAFNSGIYSCNYNTADGPVAGNTLATPEAGIDPAQMFDANNSADGAEEVPDMGDGAVMTGDDNFPILMVLVGDNLYSVSVLAGNLDSEGKRQATIDLARLSVDRLP